MTAALFEAAESARRIIAAHEAYDWRTSSYEDWVRYSRTAAAEAVTVARALLAMPEVQAVQWRPATAGGKS